MRNKQEKRAMQIKKLTIHNIASIEDAVIDFSGPELGKAPIFLICGETGAGKTTILDAICLALYGDTPRMTSVSKEELELPDSSDSRLEKYYSNDNSQLLHRGAGEGYSKLLFSGNDGKDYEAVWEVHRAHNKAHKRLMRPSRMLYATDGSYNECRLNEIKTKVVELTGLDYDQFCRTVMLAQGEFTKFLKSSKSEKSEILEKLTGTEIYSRIGIRIAEIYNETRGKWQMLKEDIDRLHLIDSETLYALDKRKKEVKAEIETITSELSLLSTKLAWLQTDFKNKESLEKTSRSVDNLEKSVRSESFIKDKTLVNDYEISGVGRGVVKNLGQNERNIQKKTGSLPTLLENLVKAKETEAKKSKEKDEIEKKVNLRELEIEKADLDGIAKRYDALLKEDNLYSSLMTQIERERGEGKALLLGKDQIVEYKERKEKNEKKSVCLEGQIAEASRNLNTWSEKLERVEVSVSDMVRDMRSRLRQGDFCPVCGTIVEKEIGEEYFDSILSPIRESKKKAEETYRDLKAGYEASIKLVESDNKALKKLEEAYSKGEEKYKKKMAETERLKKDANLSDYKTDKIEDICLERRKAIKEEVDKLNEKQKNAEIIQKDLKKLKIQLKAANAESDKAKAEVVKIELNVKGVRSEIKALETAKDDMWEELRLFFIKNPSLTMQRIKELSEYDKDEMLILKERLYEAEDRLKMEKGKLEALKTQVAEHDAIRPELKAEDTKENLEDSKFQAEERIRNLSEESGRISEVLARDKEQRKELTLLQEKFEKAREEYEKMEGLYNRLGDLKGSKFRGVAQSFILRSLLENANLYMKRFNDRYTLTCNPGTLAILVKDDYKPSEPQPSSILSGGESFMASLSLALALSNLRSGGVSADILFIDEGFGTLSGEYLGNVMDTLERLHQIGGRKVGLISHVTEMKERIPVQIRVHRESPALSRIDVVESY